MNDSTPNKAPEERDDVAPVSRADDQEVLRGGWLSTSIISAVLVAVAIGTFVSVTTPPDDDDDDMAQDEAPISETVATTGATTPAKAILPSAQADDANKAFASEPEQPVTETPTAIKP